MPISPTGRGHIPEPGNSPGTGYSGTRGAYWTAGGRDRRVQPMGNPTRGAVSDRSAQNASTLATRIQSLVQKLILNGRFNPQTDKLVILVKGEKSISHVYEYVRASRSMKNVTNRLTDTALRALKAVGITLSPPSDSVLPRTATKSSPPPSTAQAASKPNIAPRAPTSSSPQTSQPRGPAATARLQEPSSRARKEPDHQGLISVRLSAQQILDNPQLIDRESDKNRILGNILDAHEAGKLPSQQIASRLRSIHSEILRTGSVTPEIRQQLLELSTNCPKSKSVFATSTDPTNTDPLRALKDAIDHVFSYGGGPNIGEATLLQNYDSDLASIYDGYITKALSALIQRAISTTTEIERFATSSISSDLDPQIKQTTLDICADIVINIPQTASQAPQARPTSAKPQTLRKATIPVSYAAAPVSEANLPRNFKKTIASNGDCGPSSLADQLNQKNIYPEDGSPYNQQDIRNIAKNYILRNTQNLAQADLHLDTREARIMATIIGSLNEAHDEDTQRINEESKKPVEQRRIVRKNLPDKVGRILDDQKPKKDKPVPLLTDDQKRTLITAYAELIGTPQFWFDNGAFEAVASALNKDIVFIRPDQGNVTINERFFGGRPDLANALFIYYNGEIGSQSRGNHLESINLQEQQILSSLINNYNAQKLNDFMQELTDQKSKLNSTRDKIVGISKQLADLENFYPNAFQAIETLLQGKWNASGRGDTEPSETEALEIFFNLSKDEILNQIRLQRG